MSEFGFTGQLYELNSMLGDIYTTSVSDGENSVFLKLRGQRMRDLARYFGRDVTVRITIGGKQENEQRPGQA